jgi:hypothetical protein
MKLAVALALVLTCPVTALAADDALARLDAKAEACISTSAAEVAKAEPNLSAATDFLVNDLCARDIETAAKYRLSRKVLDLLIKQQKSTMAMIPPTTVAAVAAPAKPTAGAASPVPVVDDKAAKAAEAKQTKLAGLEAARINAETGELEGLPAPYSMITDLANLVLGMRAPAPTADIKAFAARAVLSARQATR